MAELGRAELTEPSQFQGCELLSDSYRSGPNLVESRPRRRVRTYVILVLPKCLLTWGHVKVDPAAFCLQHEGPARRMRRAGGDLTSEHVPQE